MNTPSHFLIGATVQKFSRGHLIRSAFLWGSVAPDIPLYLLTLGGWIYYVQIKQWPLREAFGHMFDELFFENWFWIAYHNLLHSPLVLTVAIAALWRFRNAVGTTQRWFYQFFWACSLHTAIDIPTHVHDGPLLLFPLNWSLRFVSPVSYWDSQYFGQEFAIFEIALNFLLMSILLRDPFLRFVKRFRPQAD